MEKVKKKILHLLRFLYSDIRHIQGLVFSF